jgi:hypothetical protein
MSFITQSASTQLLTVEEINWNFLISCKTQITFHLRKKFSPFWKDWGQTNEWHIEKLCGKYILTRKSLSRAHNFAWAAKKEERKFLIAQWVMRAYSFSCSYIMCTCSWTWFLKVCNISENFKIMSILLFIEIFFKILIKHFFIFVCALLNF